MDNHAELLFKRVLAYEKWMKRLGFVLFYVASILGSYKYAFKQGQINALQTILEQLQTKKQEDASTQRYVKPDGEPGNLQHPLSDDSI